MGARKYPKDVPLTNKQREMVEKHLWVADWLVGKKYTRLGHQAVEELLCVARGGLVRAAQCFDDGRGVSFTTYAARWAWQFCQNHLKPAKKRVREVSVMWGGEDEDEMPYDPEDRRRGTDPADRDLLEKALRVLPARERDVLRLRYEMGYSIEEVGRAMRVTKTRIQQLESNALSKIRERMAVEYASFAG